MAKEVRTVGRAFSAEVEIYNVCKYNAPREELENPIVVRYDGITSWEIVSGYEAWEIERETDEASIDDYHEYLVLHFENGETSTFRNSYVDMFRVR